MLLAVGVGDGVAGVVPEREPTMTLPETCGAALLAATDPSGLPFVDESCWGSRSPDARAPKTAAGATLVAFDVTAAPPTSTDGLFAPPLTGAALVSVAFEGDAFGGDAWAGRKAIKPLDAMAAGRPTVADAGSIPSGSR